VNFLQNIFDRLTGAPERAVLEEMRPDGRVSATAGSLLDRIAAARAFLAAAGLGKGDRCALLAPNSIPWVALDLAAMEDGIIVVPLYSRQAPAELAAMIRDAQPAIVCCGDGALRDALSAALPDAPRTVLLDEIFSAPAAADPKRLASEPSTLADTDPVAIIYTSGTSGEPKGVVLNVGNVTFMLSCTTARLELLMGNRAQADRVFHYLPFCFAGSWILLLSSLLRLSELRLCMDLAHLADDLREAAPDYCLNVPQLLERVRAAVEAELAKRGGVMSTIFSRAKAASIGNGNGSRGRGGVSLFMARMVIFPAIRKKLGPNLRALICGSAPLALETQLFFHMIGIPVLQVYGLTETTAICTMDDPRRVEPGTVGPAIPGIEMRLGDQNEILVRGPSIFPGYWNRPEETAKVMSNGWFRTGDQGEKTPGGNWRILGRLKNLLVLSSGHNVAPEPLEEKLRCAIPAAKQVVVFGHGRSFLSALVTGDVTLDSAQAAIGDMNSGLPHYRQIRAFHLQQEPLTIESGLLTANGKLRRDAIAMHFRDAIESMYGKGARI
jgi:long-chain acyl-CoA synthetase